jgi:peptide/nickel transport system substrate-binding protein
VIAIPALGTGDFSPAGSGDDNEKAISMMGEALVGVDPDSRQLVGELAESYELSDDGKTWTFTLKPDIPFHDGYGTVTSEDVKHSWEGYIAPDSTHGGAAQMAQAVDGDISNFEIVDDHTFKLHTENPVVFLPATLCSCNNGMVVSSKKYFDEKGADAEKAHPILTGPFQFVSFQPGVEMVMKAVPDHWRRTPAFETARVLEIPDGAARLVQVQSGAVDLAELDPILSGEAEAAGLNVLPIKDIGNAFVILGGMYDPSIKAVPDDPDRVFVNDDDSPWIQADNPDKGLACREAMSLAIDRQTILEQILQNHGSLATGPLIQYNANPELNDPSWDVPEFNLEKAKQKLAECGYPDGFKVQIFDYPGGEVDTSSVNKAIAGMWRDLGLEVEEIQAEEDILDERLDRADTAGLAWTKYAGWAAEPAETLIRYSVRKARDYKLNSPIIEDGYDKSAVELDPAKRWQIARDVITELRDTQTLLSLFNVDMLFVAGPDIGGWDPIPGLNAFTRPETITPAGG